MEENRMSSIYQRTLSQTVSYEGTALHSGTRTRITLRPADPDTGYVFIRTDLDNRPLLSLVPGNIGNTVLNTSLEKDGVVVKTIEHVMASLSGLGIDNCIIEIEGEEPPVGDGSAARFVAIIKEAGIREQDKPKRVKTLKHPIIVSDGDKYIAAFPAKDFRVSFTFVTNHPEVGTQYADFLLDSETFEKEISRARTIGFLEQIEELKRRGLALGGSMEVAVVVDKDRVLTPLRYPDEIVRHKILDIIGDFSVLSPFAAHVIAVKSGHALNAKFTRLAAGILVPVEEWPGGLGL